MVWLRCEVSRSQSRVTRWPAEVPAEILEEGDQAQFVVSASLGLEVEAGALAVPAVAERRGRRDPLPVDGVDDDGSLSSRRPGSADGRDEREP
jgi:hypothetical protein